MALNKEDIIKQLQITSDLRREFERQAAIYASWAFQSARAQDQVRKFEERQELLFSRFYAEYRAEHRDAKENDCKSYIRDHADYKAGGDELNQARYKADLLKAATRAFEMRRDMLIQLGAQVRAEQEASGMTSPSVKRTREAQTRKANQVIRDKIAGKRKGREND